MWLLYERLKQRLEMKLPSLKIRNLESRFPVIQAGMGVRVGNSLLASETIKLGGYGVIASVGLGDIEKSKTDFVEESNRVLRAELQKARELAAGKKPLGVNIMVALSNYKEMVKTSVDAGVDFIISGAGLPLPLPEYVGDADIALIPILSGARALELLLKAWKRKYDRTPDAVIVESPYCGGHLGFSFEQLAEPCENFFSDVISEMRPVLEKYGVGDIPLIAAGEVASRKDIEEVLAMGYAGVQIGTLFLGSEEAGLDRKTKEVIINAVEEDVVVIKSPVGLPVRVLKTALVERVMNGQREKFICPYRCLRTCNPSTAPFCIAKAMLAAWSGDIDNAVVMTGSNVETVNKIYPLKEFFDTLED